MPTNGSPEITKVPQNQEQVPNARLMVLMESLVSELNPSLTPMERKSAAMRIQPIMMEILSLQLRSISPVDFASFFKRIESTAQNPNEREIEKELSDLGVRKVNNNLQRWIRFASRRIERARGFLPEAKILGHNVGQSENQVEYNAVTNLFKEAGLTTLKSEAQLRNAIDLGRGEAVSNPALLKDLKVFAAFVADYANVSFRHFNLSDEFSASSQESPVISARLAVIKNLYETSATKELINNYLDRQINLFIAFFGKRGSQTKNQTTTQPLPTTTALPTSPNTPPHSILETRPKIDVNEVEKIAKGMKGIADLVRGLIADMQGRPQYLKQEYENLLSSGRLEKLLDWEYIETLLDPKTSPLVMDRIIKSLSENKPMDKSNEQYISALLLTKIYGDNTMKQKYKDKLDSLDKLLKEYT
jgi:hypothetical protein